MYQTLKDQSYQNYTVGNQIAQSGLAGYHPRLDNEGMKKEREASLERFKTELADYDVLVSNLWEALRFMRSQGFYSENSFQLSAVQHLQSALSDVLLRQKDKQQYLEQYEAEHKKASQPE